MKLFFGDIIGLCTKGFIPMTVAFYFGIQFHLTTTVGEVIAYYNAWMVGFLIYIFYPCAMIYCIAVKKETLTIPEFKYRWGSLWSNVKTETRWQRAFRLIFILRRFSVLYISISLVGRPIFQIQLILLGNLFMSIYSGLVHPFKTRFQSKIDLANESLVSIMTYHLVIFTDFAANVDVQYASGWSFVFFLVLYLVLNAFFVLRDMSKNFRLLAIKKWRVYKAKKGYNSKVGLDIVNSSIKKDESSDDESSNSSIEEAQKQKPEPK